MNSIDTALKWTGWTFLAIVLLNLLTWAGWGQSTDLILGVHVFDDSYADYTGDTLVVFAGRLEGALWHQVADTDPRFRKTLARKVEAKSGADTVLQSEDPFRPGHPLLASPAPTHRFALVPNVQAWRRVPLVSVVETAIMTPGYVEAHACVGVWGFHWWPVWCRSTGVS